MTRNVRSEAERAYLARNVLAVDCLHLLVHSLGVCHVLSRKLVAVRDESQRAFAQGKKSERACEVSDEVGQLSDADEGQHEAFI